MDSSKLKNIILAVLIAVNLVFAGMLLSDRLASAAALSDTRDSLEKVLSARGITLSDEVDIGLEAPEEYSLSRDLDSELGYVRKLLGDTAAYDQGGNVYYYSGEKGEGNFRGTGEFTIAMSDGMDFPGSDPEASAKKAAKSLGFDPFVISSDADEPLTVSLGYFWRGSEVFNGRLEFSFSEKRLLLIYGERAFDSVTDKTGSKTLDCPTAVMRFAELSEESGREISVISAVEPGYIMTVTVNGEGVMTPAWRITTDCGVFCINAVTGREEALPE